MDFARLPICVVSFNRPGYLRRTLASLATARLASGHKGPVALFQDGAVNPHSGQRKAAEEEVAACVEVFQAAFPDGMVFAAPVNLGIGRNLARAEHWAFTQLAAPAALFFEDDMALAPHYLRVLRGLYALACEEPRIAMFAAYGADGRASLAEQRAARRAIGPMHHNWGFGLTRAAWERRETLTRDYTALLEGCDYRDRPLERIAAWYVRLGWPPLPTSQDIAKSAALNTLGLVRVSSVAICARYIGEVGQHYTPDEFRRLRFGEVAVFPDDGEAWVFDRPSPAQLDAIVAQQRAEILAQRLGPEPFLASGGFIEALRIARAVGATGLLPDEGTVPVSAAAGLYDDGWCAPEASLVFPAVPGVRGLVLEGAAAEHLPLGTSLVLALNGQPAATLALAPGASFALSLEVPAHLSGLEMVLSAACSVRADPFSVHFNQDRRPLAFRLVRLGVTRQDGTTVQMEAEALLRAVLGSRSAHG
jgi:hypothetical protein